MRRFIAAVLVLLAPVTAWAQTASPTPSTKNLDTQPYQAQLQAPCVVQADGRTCVGVNPQNGLPTIPGVVTSSSISGTTSATPNTFTQLAAASTARKGCLIQNTSTAVIYVFVGSGAATLGGAFQLAPASGTTPGDTFSCSLGNAVIGDTLQIAASAASATYAGVIQ